jgi:predicted membrane protein
MEDNKTVNSRVLLGGILIIVGLLLFLSINDYMDFNISRVIFSFPFFMFIIGLFILINSRNRTLGVILVVIGGLFLMPKIFPGIDINASLIFPLLIIALGVAIIVNKRKPSKLNIGSGPAENIRKDYIEDVAVFGGGTKTLVTDNFRGGNITAVFGGSEIDLSACRLAEGDNILDVLMVFGGTDITIPRDWNVIINVTPLFGGFSNKVIRDPSMVIDTSRTLVVKGIALFGGGEVKNKY